MTGPTDPGFEPRRWLRGPHAQTILPNWPFRRARVERRAAPMLTAARELLLECGDGVTLQAFHSSPGQLDVQPGPRGHDRRLAVILHGWEGSADSTYMLSLGQTFFDAGYETVRLNLRDHGATHHLNRELFHSCRLPEVVGAVRNLATRFPGLPIVLAGFSLGGNVLLKYLGERGDDVPAAVRAAAGVSVPYDLARGSRHIGQGFSRVYQRSFLQSLKRKALAKLEQFPDLADRARIDAARTLYDFDDVVTAPVHGFADAADYYRQSSAMHFLSGIRVPTLLLSAVDDPFLPADVLDEVRGVASGNPMLRVEFIARGGHVGFIAGAVPWRPFYYAEWRVGDFLEHALQAADAHPRSVVAHG